MNAVDLPNDDFGKLLKLLTQRGVTSVGGSTAKAFEELREALNLHMKMERGFYPSIKPYVEVRPLIERGYDDHLKIAGLVLDMSQLKFHTTSRDWRDLLVQLNVPGRPTHFSEKQLLPEAQSMLGATRPQELFYELDRMRSEQSETDTLNCLATRLGANERFSEIRRSVSPRVLLKSMLKLMA
jgi:hypothetical protein